MYIRARAPSPEPESLFEVTASAPGAAAPKLLHGEAGRGLDGDLIWLMLLMMLMVMVVVAVVLWTTKRGGGEGRSERPDTKNLIWTSTGMGAGIYPSNVPRPSECPVKMQRRP